MEEKKKANLKVIIAIVVIAIIGVVGAVILTTRNTSKYSNNEQQTQKEMLENEQRKDLKDNAENTLTNKEPSNDETDIMTIETAIKAYLAEDYNQMNTAKKYFNENSNDFEILDNSKLNELLQGTFLQISNGTYVYYHWMYDYSNGMQTTLGQFSSATDKAATSGKVWEYKPIKSNINCKVAIKDNLFYLLSSSKEKVVCVYQVRKLKDNYYMLYEPNESNNSLLVKYTGNGETPDDYKWWLYSLINAKD